MLNAAIRLTFSARMSEHTSPLLSVNSNLGCVLWHFIAFTAQHLHALPIVEAMLPMSTVVVVFVSQVYSESLVVLWAGQWAINTG